jgi:hypothetical protein
MNAEPPDLVIRRCDVRVVRRGGWSWGPDPDALPRRVVEALPALLARHVADRLAEQLAGRPLGEDENIEITEPVTIDLTVSLADLLSGSLPTTPPAPHLAAASVPDLPAPAAPPARPGTDDPDRGTDPAAAPPSRADAERELDRLLARLAEGGVLSRLTAEQFAHLAGELTGSDAETAGVAPAPDSSRQAGTRVTGEVEVGSALPFLLASALHRIGMVEALGPALAATGLAGDAPLFAAALAHKVLGVPHRGWLRSPQDVRDTAAFAGLPNRPDGVDGAELAAFARRAGPALARWDGLLGLSVCAGHRPGQPLLLARTADGLLLAEAEGLFPIARADEPAALLPYWEACDRPPVLLLGTGPAAPALRTLARRDLRALADAGVPMAAEAAPSRGERWTRLPRSGPFDLPLVTADLAELVGELTRRPAVPRESSEPALERSVTLTAAVALGTLSWLLWRHRERPVPQLALARLGDLGGLVRFGTEAVDVRLPLGRRRADLLERGLLADVPGVPWLGGRTLTFGGG